MNWNYLLLCGMSIIFIVLLMDMNDKVYSAIIDYNFEFCVVNNSGSFATECFGCEYVCQLPNGSVIEIPGLTALSKLERLKS